MTNPNDFTRKEQESILRRAIDDDDVIRINLELTDIMHGVNIDNLFYDACEAGSLGAVKALLLECADPIPAECLQAAGENGHWEVVRFLLPRLAATVVVESAVLGYAAESGERDMVNILLKIPEVVIQGGVQAIEQAASANQQEIIKLLIPQVSLEDLSQHLCQNKSWAEADLVGGTLSLFDRGLWLEKFPPGTLPQTLACQRQEEALAREPPRPLVSRPRARG